MTMSLSEKDCCDLWKGMKDNFTVPVYFLLFFSPWHFK